MHECIQDGQHTHGVTPETSPEERLRIYIRAEINFLGTHNDTDDIMLKRSRLLLREVTRDDPDPMTFQSHLEHEARVLHPIIRELVGELQNEEVFQQACIAATGIITHDFIMSIHDPTQRLQSDEQIEAGPTSLPPMPLAASKPSKRNTMLKRIILPLVAVVALSALPDAVTKSPRPRHRLRKRPWPWKRRQSLPSPLKTS